MPLPPELVAKKRKAASGDDAHSKADEKTREAVAAAVKAAKERGKTLWSETGAQPYPELNYGGKEDRLEYIAWGETVYDPQQNPRAAAADGDASASHDAPEPAPAGGRGASPPAAPAAKKVRGIRVGHWRQARSPEGECYWYHALTKETRWDTPDFSEEELAQLAAAEAAAAAAAAAAAPEPAAGGAGGAEAQLPHGESGRGSPGAAGAADPAAAAAAGAAWPAAEHGGRGAEAPEAAAWAAVSSSAAVEPQNPQALPGWYYADYAGAVQGPFTVDQLRSWRAHLPMEIPVWLVSEAAGSGGALEASAADSLANVLGDAQLLADLRRGLLYPLPGNATAAQAEQQRAALAARAADPSTWAAALGAARTEEERARAALYAATTGGAAAGAGGAAAGAGGEGGGGDEGGGGFSAAELAAAVMEGLSPEERLEILLQGPSRHAAAGGGVGAPAIAQAPAPRLPVALPLPVEGEESEFSTDPYSFGAVYNKRTGRLTAVNIPRGEEAKRLAVELVRGRTAGAYYDPLMDHFMDTTQLENWAKEKADGGKPKVPQAVWKKLKEEKQAKKQAAAKAWLRD